MTPFQRTDEPYLASGAARQLAELARAAGLGSSPDDALQWNREAIALLAGEEDNRLLADVLRWQGSVFRDRGRTSEAEPLYLRSLDMAERLRYDAGIGHALNCLASLAQRRGDISRAASLVTDALVVAERCGVSPGNVVMMLAGPTLRTVPVTTHLPLKEVASVICQ